MKREKLIGIAITAFSVLLTCIGSLLTFIGMQVMNKIDEQSQDLKKLLVSVPVLYEKVQGQESRLTKVENLYAGVTIPADNSNVKNQSMPMYFIKPDENNYLIKRKY